MHKVIDNSRRPPSIVSRSSFDPCPKPKQKPMVTPTPQPKVQIGTGTIAGDRLSYPGA